MANSSFKPGDTVQLKSGGPLMTVKTAPYSHMQETVVACTWFDGNEKKEDVFAVVLLDISDD